MGFPHNLKVALNIFRLEIITDTNDKVKLRVLMDLVAQTTIMPQKMLNTNAYPVILSANYVHAMG